MMAPAEIRRSRLLRMIWLVDEFSSFVKLVMIGPELSEKVGRESTLIMSIITGGSAPRPSY